MKEIGKIIIFILLGILLGIVVTNIFPDICNLKFKREIGLEPFINLISALCIAFFLKQAYEKRLSDFRVEKNLIIEHVQESIGLAKELHEDFIIAYKSNITTELFEKIIAGSRNLSNSISCCEDICDALDYPDLVKDVKNLKNQFFTFKQIITGNRVAGERYDGRDNQKQEASFNDLNKSFYKLIIKVNRK